MGRAASLAVLITSRGAVNGGSVETPHAGTVGGDQRSRVLAMRRIWIVLLAIVSMNTVLLSGCPVSPPAESVSRGGSGAGGGGGGSY